MRGSVRILVAMAAALALAACAGSSGGDQITSEMQNRRQLCEKWTGNPDDPQCLSTFRRILP